MVVVMSGSAGVELHAIGRALGRALDATVIDGDRLRPLEAPTEVPTETPTKAWLRGLGAELLEPRPRPHVVATCTALTPQERRALRRCCPALLLVILRDPADPSPAEEPDDDTLVADLDGRVEVVAARLYRCLVLRQATTYAPDVVTHA